MTTWLSRLRGVAVLLMLLGVLGLARAADYGQTIAQQYGYYPDFAATLRVQLIGKRLALAAGLPQAEFQIFNERELNAMALPDGRIFVTSLMATSVTDDELAFVLGHELTHIKEKHAKGQMSRATGGAILGAIIVAALGGSESEIRTGADIAGGLTYGHYSRKDEHRADAGGVRLMVQAGYEPEKAADAMQRLIDKYGRGDAKVPVLGWFATHPDSQSRKDRLLELAKDMRTKPPERLEAPRGIQLALDPSAEHAGAWLHPFLSIMLPHATVGRAVLLPSAKHPLPDLPASWLEKQAKTVKPDDPKKAEKIEPLPKVAVVIPASPPRYQLTVAFAQAPAGGAATIEAGEGTAVAAILSWRDTVTGMHGTITSLAQRRERIPWMAHEEVKEADALKLLEDGRDTYLEGTLEAAALRRAMRALAEVIIADGPVNHSVPVTIKYSPKGLRVNDYLAVYRDNIMVSEVRIDSLDTKSITGTVLWGTHTWKKKDRFTPLP